VNLINDRKHLVVDGERGQGLAEYLIIVVVIAVAVIFGVRYFGTSVTNQFQNATKEIDSVGDSSKSSLLSGDSSKTTTSPNSGNTSTASQSSESAEDDYASESSSGVIESAGAGGTDTSAGAGGDSLKARKVGEQDGEVIDEIEIDWGLLVTLAAIVIAGGVYAVIKYAPGGKKKNKQKKEKRKSKFTLKNNPPEGGQAMVEFVLVAITFLFTILGVIQLAMVLNAYALVRYAAYNSARAAIVHANDAVVLDEKMHEAARLSLLAIFPSHGRADHIRGLVENYVAAKETDRDPSLTFFNEPITKAEVVNNNGLPAGAVVTFDDFTEGTDAVITVKVEHQYELVIPLVNRILFFVYTKFRSGEGYQNQTLDNMSAQTDKLRRVGEFKDIEYRIPLVAHYTMRLQSDYEVQ